MPFLGNWEITNVQSLHVVSRWCMKCIIDFISYFSIFYVTCPNVFVNVSFFFLANVHWSKKGWHCVCIWEWYSYWWHQFEWRKLFWSKYVLFLHVKGRSYLSSLRPLLEGWSFNLSLLLYKLTQCFFSLQIFQIKDIFHI